jgi:hypothetical protein
MTTSTTKSGLRRCARRIAALHVALGHAGRPETRQRIARALAVQEQLQALHRASKILGGAQ